MVGYPRGWSPSRGREHTMCRQYATERSPRPAPPVRRPGLTVAGSSLVPGFAGRLTVSSPVGRDEFEAERMATAVAAMPEQPAIAGLGHAEDADEGCGCGGTVQRQAAPDLEAERTPGDEGE